MAQPLVGAAPLIEFTIKKLLLVAALLSLQPEARERLVFLYLGLVMRKKGMPADLLLTAS